MVTIRSGSLDDFFDSALETAKEIDEGKKVTAKHTIWMESEDMAKMLKPQRRILLKYLKNKTKVYYSSIIEELKKSPSSLNKDLELFSKYNLIKILKEPNKGHGIRKVIKPLFYNEDIEFKTVI